MVEPGQLVIGKPILRFGKIRMIRCRSYLGNHDSSYYSIKVHCMKGTYLGAVFVSWLVLSNSMFGQDPIASSAPVDDLSSLAIAKISGDTKKVVVRVPGWRMVYETKEVEVPVTITTEIEQVVEENGQKKVKKVQVPRQVMQKQAQTISKLIPKASVRGEIAIRDMKVWTTKGKQLTPTEVESLLAKTTYLFALTAEPTPGKPPMDPFFANALRADVLLVFSPKLLDVFLESIEEEGEVPQEK
jgi:hypothetical protein